MEIVGTTGFFSEELLREIEQLGMHSRGRVASGDVQFADGSRAELGPEMCAVITHVLSTAPSGHIALEKMNAEMSRAEAAAMLGVSNATLQKFIDSGRLIAHGDSSEQKFVAEEVLALRAQRLVERQQAFAKLRELEEKYFPED